MSSICFILIQDNCQLTDPLVQHYYFLDTDKLLLLGILQMNKSWIMSLVWFEVNEEIVHAYCLSSPNKVGDKDQKTVYLLASLSLYIQYFFL